MVLGKGRWCSGWPGVGGGGEHLDQGGLTGGLHMFVLNTPKKWLLADVVGGKL